MDEQGTAQKQNEAGEDGLPTTGENSGKRLPDHYKPFYLD